MPFWRSNPGRACRTCFSDEKCTTKVSGSDLKSKGSSEDPSLDWLQKCSAKGGNSFQATKTRMKMKVDKPKCVMLKPKLNAMLNAKTDGKSKVVPSPKPGGPASAAKPTALATKGLPAPAAAGHEAPLAKVAEALNDLIKPLNTSGALKYKLSVVPSSGQLDANVQLTDENAISEAAGDAYAPYACETEACAAETAEAGVEAAEAEAEDAAAQAFGGPEDLLAGEGHEEHVL
eukprot:tig00021181_g19312.t1